MCNFFASGRVLDVPQIRRLPFINKLTLFQARDKKKKKRDILIEFKDMSGRCIDSRSL